MAANTEVMRVLKAVVTKVTTSKLTERRTILTDAVDCLTSTQIVIPDNAVKGLVSSLSTSIHLYRDTLSRKQVQAILECLLDKEQEAAVKAILGVLCRFAEEQRNRAKCGGHGTAAYVALGWTFVLIRKVFAEDSKQQGSEWKRLVECQSGLAAAALNSRRRSIRQATYQKLRKSWKRTPSLWSNTISVLEELEPSAHQLCMVSLLVRSSQEKKSQTSQGFQKKIFVDGFIKITLGGKQKPPLYLLECCNYFLQSLTHDEFKDKMLPAINKGLLRSPENVLQAVNYIIAGVSLDLSQYSLDLAKSIATQLHSKDEKLQQIAEAASYSLAKQCSDSEAVENVAKHFIAVLGGSEGKLALPPERMGVLSGVKGLSNSGIMGSSSQQTIATSVCDMIIPYLKQEVHEGTLVYAIEVLSQWCTKFSSQVPATLTDWIEKAFALKQTTTAVRNAYFQCMLVLYKGDNLIEGVKLIPVMKQSVEKAKQQPNQVAMVMEGFSAACCLAQIALADVGAEEKVSFLWPLLDSTQMFTAEKFLQTISEEGLFTLVKLVEKLLIDHMHRIKPSTAKSYSAGFIKALVHPSWKLRQAARQAVRKILDADRGESHTAFHLLEEFATVINAEKPLGMHPTISAEGDKANDPIPPKVLASALQSLLPVTYDRQREEEIGYDLVIDHLLITASHPCIYSHRPSLWVDMTRKLVTDVHKMVSDSEERILVLLLEKNNASQSAQNAIQSLAKCCPNEFLPALMERVKKTLLIPDLATVTLRDYCIMNTPDGELYDKSIIEGKGQESESVGSMKRQNKAYSYKEQLMEIELKKIYTELEQSSRLLLASVVGNPSASAQYIPDLLSPLLSLLSSPLAATVVMATYVQISTCLFDKEKHILASCVAYCTFRLMEPAATINPDWTALSLKEACIKALDHIYQGTHLHLPSL
ncbi:hypothetical protein BSL78_18539 [Apostichopus japonicus]|uniref:Stalled ribosome sensor GCN1-like N-terminal domain-containing protein n=1 Tax=Stichopus japonicus TaxID=307972 RepID=A0A2G8K9C8_STIJA|nr:hypothetical protein BSL78_18539 [Apostichopus japonicus]